MLLMASQFVLLLLLYPLVYKTSKAQQPLQYSNITKGSTLYTNSTPSFWPSPSGHFAFGFYPIGDGFKVGIWIVGSPKNTVVWTARRNDPVVLRGSFLCLATDGRLLLRTSLGDVRPLAEPEPSPGATSAAMHNNGNFLLFGYGNKKVIWESFDHPTDTLLVGQKLVRDHSLYSSVSDTDHSTGRFRLWMQADGNVNALPAGGIQDLRYYYWTTYTSGAGNNLSLYLQADSRLDLQNSSGFVIKKVTEGGFPTNRTSYTYRATLDADGVFRLYQHRLGTNSSDSSVISLLWSSLAEEHRCSVNGICGLNSYCSINGSNVACLCPPGFDFVDPQQPTKGCKLNYTSENGCSGVVNAANYFFTALENTKWERNEYEILSPVSEGACLNACLEDCNCMMATMEGQFCFKQKFPLRFGRKDHTNPTKTLVKIRKGSQPPVHIDGEKTNMRKASKGILIVGVVLISFSLVLFVSSGCLIYKHLKKYFVFAAASASSTSPRDHVIEEINLRAFSYGEIVEATNNFSEEIGKGSSGRVYKGSLAAQLQGGRVLEIAVKKLEHMMQEGEDQNEFRNEMKIIGRARHKNLVRLVGFCSEGSNRLLVYEFMKNGSLGNLLFKAKTRPSWKERGRILVEIAKGLSYLHEDCETTIIHCDVKPHNILMDESWSARVSDFGLSKLLRPDQTRTYTVPRGTRGYEAPEWYRRNEGVTVRVDVYSFGILLFEVICCRKNVERNVPEEEVILVDWVCECYEKGEVWKLVGSEEEGVDVEELEKMVRIGLLCVQTEPTLRPTMKMVILMLEGTVATPPLPPSPSSSS